MFDWNNIYSVGIGSVDAQHQNLFRLANELHSAMASGRGKAACGRILERLVQYTETHFAHEERLMRQCNYPDFAAHKAEHEALTRKVKEFQVEYESGRIALTVHLLNFLKSWLVGHIQKSDRKFAPHLKAVA